MEKNKKSGIVLLIAGVLVLALLLFVISGAWAKKKEESKKAGIVLSGSMTEDGWNGMHYQGIKTACEKSKVQLFVSENVSEFSGQCENAVRELAETGCNMIVLSSYGYSEEIYEIVDAYPEIVFFANSSEYHAENLTSYFIKMYQARYLAGIVAGMMTENNQIGYVAAMENHEVNRGISAFTLGVRQANPAATVTVIFTGTWDDEEKEKAAAGKLIENIGVDVISCHQNKTYVVEAAEEAGIYSIGYHETSKHFSDKYLTAVKCDWNIVYQELMEKFLKGEANKVENIWIGIDKGAIGLSEFSTLVPEEVRKAVEKAEMDMLSGKEVFSGEIYDMEGNMQCGDDEMISDERLLEQFDWFVEGVKFYEE